MKALVGKGAGPPRRAPRSVVTGWGGDGCPGDCGLWGHTKESRALCALRLSSLRFTKWGKPGAKSCLKSFLFGFNKWGLHPHRLFGPMKKTSVSTQRRLAAGLPLGGGLGTEKEGRHFLCILQTRAVHWTLCDNGHVLCTVQYGSH